MLYSGNGKDHGHSSADRGNTMQPTSRPNYGRTLQILGTADSGPVMDCAVSGNFLYAAGAGRLRIFSLEEPFQPRFRGELAGLGNTRQIEIADSTAHITSREDGYFQVDVTDPAHPVLLSHYDTIEMAPEASLSSPAAPTASSLWTSAIRCGPHISARSAPARRSRSDIMAAICTPACGQPARWSSPTCAISADRRSSAG